MTAYHVNPETGEPGVCSAQIQCRFGDFTEHYGTVAQARSAYEKKQGSPFAEKVSPYGDYTSEGARGPVVSITNSDAEFINDFVGNNLLNGDTEVSSQMDSDTDDEHLQFTVSNSYGEDDIDPHEFAEGLVNLAKMHKLQGGQSDFVKWAASDPNASKTLAENLEVGDDYWGKSYTLKGVVLK